MVKVDGFLVQHFGIKEVSIGEDFIVKQLVLEIVRACGGDKTAKLRDWIYE